MSQWSNKWCSFLIILSSLFFILWERDLTYRGGIWELRVGGGNGVTGRQVMKCDVPYSRNSSVSVLFFSLVPWVSPAFSPSILVSTHIRWLDRMNYSRSAHDLDKNINWQKDSQRGAEIGIAWTSSYECGLMYRERTYSFQKAGCLCETCWLKQVNLK